MKPEERAAYQYLLNQFGGNIVYEPDGNQPPDLLVDSSYAIEVRRLNQQYWKQGRPVGLETDKESIWAAFCEVLESFGSDFRGTSYWVFISFRRPRPPTMKTLKNEMKAALQGYLETYAGATRTVCVNQQIKFFIHPAAEPEEGRVFLEAGSSDHDRGGWLVSLYIDSIQHSIQEKSHKIASQRSRYHTWWLMLVDHMGWGLAEAEIRELTEAVGNHEEFDRILVIDRSGQRLLAEF